jgi:hypothetical protein
MPIVQAALSLPSPPGPSSVTWTQNNVVGLSQSPFTGQTQAQIWPGQWLAAQVQYPSMTRAQASAIIAALVRLNGTAGTFMLGPLDCKSPRGAGLGSPLISGNNNGGSSILTKGWTPNTAHILLPFDWISIDNYLYIILSDENSDNGGNAAFDIWPNLRTAPADGDPIIINNPQGLFRLAQNQLSWEVDYAFTYGLQFNAVEAF